MYPTPLTVLAFIAKNLEGTLWLIFDYRLPWFLVPLRSDTFKHVTPVTHTTPINLFLHSFIVLFPGQIGTFFPLVSELYGVVGMTCMTSFPILKLLEAK